MSFYRDQLELYLKAQDIKGVFVADVGGYSNPVKKRVKIFEVPEEGYLIFDNGAEEGKNDFHFLDLNRPQYSQFMQEIFDIVFCLEVFEYIYDPMTALRCLHAMLKKDGVLYITFPTIYPLHNPAGIDYTRYTREAILKYFGHGSSWEILELIPRIANEEGKKALAAFWKADGMHPRKNTPEVFETGYIVKVRKIA